VSHRMINESPESIQKPIHADKSAMYPDHVCRPRFKASNRTAPFPQGQLP
jgi:hypothetical protein